MINFLILRSFWFLTRLAPLLHLTYLLDIMHGLKSGLEDGVAEHWWAMEFWKPIIYAYQKSKTRYKESFQ